MIGMMIGTRLFLTDPSGVEHWFYPEPGTQDFHIPNGPWVSARWEPEIPSGVRITSSGTLIFVPKPEEQNMAGGDTIKVTLHTKRGSWRMEREGTLQQVMKRVLDEEDVNDLLEDTERVEFSRA